MFYSIYEYWAFCMGPLFMKNIHLDWNSARFLYILFIFDTFSSLELFTTSVQCLQCINLGCLHWNWFFKSSVPTATTRLSVAKWAYYTLPVYRTCHLSHLWHLPHVAYTFVQFLDVPFLRLNVYMCTTALLLLATQSPLKTVVHYRNIIYRLESPVKYIWCVHKLRLLSSLLIGYLSYLASI